MRWRSAPVVEFVRSAIQCLFSRARGVPKPRASHGERDIAASQRFQHWDSDSSETRTRFCLDDRSDVRTREDDLGVHRADRRDDRRRTRQDNACQSVLVKLRAFGTFLRIARECASLLVLFDSDQATDPAFAVPLMARRAVVSYTWIGVWRAAAAIHRLHRPELPGGRVEAVDAEPDHLPRLVPILIKLIKICSNRLLQIWSYHRRW